MHGHTIKKRYCIHRYYYYYCIAILCLFEFRPFERERKCGILCTLFLYNAIFLLSWYDQIGWREKNAHIWLNVNTYIKKFSTQFIYSLIQYPLKMDFSYYIFFSPLPQKKKAVCVCVFSPFFWSLISNSNNGFTFFLLSPLLTREGSEEKKKLDKSSKKH